MPDGTFAATRTRARPCPVCDSAASGAIELRYGRAPWRLVRCLGCAFAYMPVVPVHDELIANLSWDRRHAQEAKRRRRDHPVQQRLDAATRWRLSLFPRTEPVDLLNRIGPRSGVVVDIGCGSGESLAHIDRRFVAHGIEISATLADRARRFAASAGGTIIAAAATDGLATFADRSIAGALLRSFLEHDADAGEVTRMLGRKLRPDGVAIIKVPNYGSFNRRVMGKGWCGFRFPDHVNYFRKKDIVRLAARHGLSASFPFLLSLPTDDNFVTVLRPVRAA